MRYSEGGDLVAPVDNNNQIARARREGYQILLPTWIIKAGWNLSPGRAISLGDDQQSQPE